MVALLYIGLLLLVALVAWLLWDRVSGLFADSETLLLSRLWLVLGAALTALEGTNWAPIISAFGVDAAKWSPVIMMISGVAVEVARKMRTKGGVLGSDLDSA